MKMSKNSNAVELLQEAITSITGQELFPDEIERVIAFIKIFIENRNITDVAVATAMLPPFKELQERFDYNPLTGEIKHARNSGGRGRQGEIAGFQQLRRGQPVRRITMTVGRTKFKMEATRVAWALHYGVWPPSDQLVQAANGDYLDLRIENLRLITPSTRNYVAKRRGPPQHGAFRQLFTKYRVLERRRNTRARKRAEALAEDMGRR